MFTIFPKNSPGFSLLEMTVSLLLLLVISGSAFQAMSYYQKNYSSTQQRVDMHSSVRAAMELLTQEIGQAGLLSFTPRTLTANVTGSPTAQAVTLNSGTDIFVGEKLTIDVGSAGELVTVTAASGSSVTGIFNNSHAAGAAVNAKGIFPQGVMSGSTSTRLQLFGDLFGDGTFQFAQYDCNYAAGTFSRSVTPVSSASINASQVLVANVIQNPGGTNCFTMQSKPAGTLIFVTSVAVTLTVQTAQKDPQTNTYVTMTKSFLNIAPRNVLNGLNQAASGLVSRIQPTPPNLPLR